MKACRKRKPDFRRIRPSQTYSVLELSEAIQREPATVRNWIRQGLPTIDGLKPKIIDGAQAKQWLCRKWALRKKPTASDEAHCLHCREPQPFADGSRSFKQVNAKVLMLTGNCALCGCRMNKFVSARSVALFETHDERKRENNAA